MGTETILKVHGLQGKGGVLFFLCSELQQQLVYECVCCNDTVINSE